MASLPSDAKICASPPSDAKIFVVDDDEADRVSLQEMLRAYGFDVEAFATATAFLNAFAPPQRGCVLLDVRLPDMSGLDAQRQLAENRINLPVIMVTAYGEVSMAVTAMKAGAVDFLEKPFTQDDLLGSVQAALGLDLDAAPEDNWKAQLTRQIELLTPREREVTEQLVLGRQNKEIAYELGISRRTVEVHRSRIMEKMKARNLAHLVRLWLGAGGVLDPPMR